MKTILISLLLAFVIATTYAARRPDKDPLRSGEICPRPRIPRGRVVPYHSRYYEHNTVVIICNYPYTRVGPLTATCKRRGVFTRLPECVACENKAPENGFSKPGRRIIQVGEVVKYGCNYGYSLENEKESVRWCSKDGKLDGREPVCERNPTCDKPTDPSLEFKGLIKDVYEIGEKVTFKCKPHQVLEPANATFVICNEEGDFNGTVPTCVNTTEPIVCKRPDSFSRRVQIKPRKKRYRPGNVVRFSCIDERYKFYGDRKAKCLADGTFDYESQPSCKPKSKPFLLRPDPMTKFLPMTVLHLLLT